MSVLQIMIGNLRQLGFFDFILPWVFAFAITWGSIKMAGLFNNQDAVAGIISLVVAFFVTNYTPYGYIGMFFTKLFGESSMVMGGILIGVLLLGLIGVKASDIFEPIKGEGIGKWLKFFFYLLIIILAIYLFMFAMGYSIPMYAVSFNQTAVAVVFALAVIGIVVWFVTRS